MLHISNVIKETFPEEDEQIYFHLGCKKKKTGGLLWRVYRTRRNSIWKKPPVRCSKRGLLEKDTSTTGTRSGRPIRRNKDN